MWELELKTRIDFLKEYNIDKRIKYDIIQLINYYFPLYNIEIKSRVKEFSSAFYKYKQKKYTNINQIKDLIGIMIICDNKKEIYDVKECIEKYKKVEKLKDYIKKPLNGYKSIHAYIRHNENLVYEIQIKTNAMQIAQKIVHDKIYKNKKIPDILKKIIMPVMFKVIIIYESIRKAKYNMSEHKNKCQYPFLKICLLNNIIK